MNKAIKKTVIKTRKNKNEKKEKRLFGLKIYEILVILLFIFLLIFLLVTKDHNNLKAHCVMAICNEDNTICYNYTEDKDGKTIKTWEGDCSKLK